MKIDNLEGGSIEAHVQALLKKGTPETPEQPEDETESPEDSPEDIEDVGDTEADDTDEEESDTEEDTPEEPKKFTVKINGKDEEVTFEELQAGYMKDRDYREKTTKVAEERKAVEAEKAKLADLSKVREDYLTESKTLQGIIGSFMVPEEKLNEMLMAKDTVSYLQAQAHNEKIAQQVAALKARDEAVSTQISEEEQKAIQDRTVAEQEALYKALPELRDDANQNALGSYILSLGYSPEDVQSVLDHRLFVALEKARRFDEFQAKAQAKPVNKVPKVTKGEAVRRGAAEVQNQKLRDLSLKAKKTGSIQDHVALLMAKSK